MNVIRGLDRMILVIAIIAVLPGFGLGFGFVREEFKTPTPEYQEYLREGNRENSRFNSLDPYDPYSPAVGVTLYRPNKSPFPEKCYHYQPVWKCIPAGLLSAFLSFVVVLYGFRGLTRGTKWFALWIIEGFRDEKTKERDSHMTNVANQSGLSERA